MCCNYSYTTAICKLRTQVTNNIFIMPASYKKYLKIKLNYKKIFN